ncbi:MAG: hypothetical protein JNK53_03920, partial [Phycisphaerae bacterium]|nr:hypothetical protein [Phycisphaerae bacterium]
AAIQKQIEATNTKRAQYIAAETAKQGPGATSFERAIRDAVRAQATARGLTFPADPAAPATPAAPAAKLALDPC